MDIVFSAFGGQDKRRCRYGNQAQSNVQPDKTGFAVMTHWPHDVVATLNQRQHDAVATLKQRQLRLFNVACPLGKLSRPVCES